LTNLLILQNTPISVGRRPQQRTGHIMTIAGDILILHGGFAENTQYKDTWHESLKRIAGLRRLILSMPAFPKLAQMKMIWNKFK
jgi:hypothetical protein